MSDAIFDQLIVRAERTRERALRHRTSCDCDLVARERTRTRPRHRWNCHLTPIWAQTIRELDTNPWTCVTNLQIYCDLSFPPVGINQWDGLPGTHCGRGPCCRGDGHSGRCLI